MSEGAKKCEQGECPMDYILTIIMGSWTTYIIWVLQNEGKLRFGELRRQIPKISPKVLTERLRRLEQSGIVSRHYEPTVPPAVTYALTARGDELKETLDSLTDIGRKWKEEDAVEQSGGA